MMAKMFYTLEETKATLAKSEDEVRQYAREGRLREFRDGPRLMFKADQVDQLKAEIAGGGGGLRSDLGPSDSGAPIGLADVTGASGSGVISLADTDFGKSPGAGLVKEDTALATDLGLSGSIGGVPSPGRPGGTGAGMSGTGAGRSGAGITVFDVDDAHRADPMAQTSIGSGIQDQVNLEGVGSGSGLLDLTRASDDTSLGAELLDEISPGAPAGGGGRRGAIVDSGMGMSLADSGGGPISRGGGGGGGAVDRSRLAAPVYVEAPDALAPAFGALSLFGVGIVLYALFVLANAIFGVHPGMVAEMSGKGAIANRGMMYLLIAVVGALVFFAVGWFIGKANAGRR